MRCHRCCPNGSIFIEGGNVLGMMPHPERSSEEEMGTDGYRIFESVIGALANK